MDDDGRLVELVQRGDQRAFVELIARHQRAVYSLCYRMTGSTAEAEDLTQETFLRFYTSAKRFHPGHPLRPWLHKIAANVTLDALRKRKLPTLPLEGDAGEPALDISDGAPTVTQPISWPRWEA